MLDAKQRVVIRSGAKFCTEPPPDVFSVYAQSLAASGQVSKSTDPTSLGVGGNLSYSSSEQGATIARTQAYNLLALQVYYNCLSSLNGDAGKLDVPIDRARLQRLIPLTVAIEQLTGALRPPTVVIGATGSSAAGGQNIVRLDDAHKAAQAASAKLTATNTAKDSLEASDPKCSALVAKLAAGTALTSDETKKKDSCDKADAAVVAANGASDDANAHYQAMLKASANDGVSSAQADVIAAQIGQASVRDEATVRQVADAIKDMVRDNSNLDEIKFFCMRMLGDPEIQQAAYGVAGGANIAGQCATYLLATVKSEEDKLFRINGAGERAEFDRQFRDAGAIIQSAADERFARYWSAILDPGTKALDTSKMTARIAAVQKVYPLAAPIQVRLQRLQQSADTATARAAFGQLPDFLQIALAQ
jgi:hypothetical protein